MPDYDELLQPDDSLQANPEAVDFGDLKSQLETSPPAVDNPLERALGSVDFGDLKSELGKGKTTGT